MLSTASSQLVAVNPPQGLQFASEPLGCLNALVLYPSSSPGVCVNLSLLHIPTTSTYSPPPRTAALFRALDKP